jgi:VWFA-related protein
LRKQIIILALLSLFLPTSLLLLAQEKKSGKEGKSPLTFRLPVDVIVVNATVNDKQENPVTDLQQSDFKIYEDGKLQNIQTFALESYEPEPPETTAIKGEPRLNASTSPNATRPRMISLITDDVTIKSIEYYPVIIKAMIRFVEQDMGSNDQVAILAGSGRVQFPFTDNKTTLLEEIGSLAQRLNVVQTDKSECPSLTDLQAKRITEGYGQDDLNDELNVAIQDTLVCTDLANFLGGSNDQAILRQAKAIARSAASRQYQESDYRIRTLLSTLRQHIRALRHFDAVKTVILLSNGFLADGNSYVSSEVQDVVNQALSSGVVLNTVNIRGLYTPMVPLSDRNTSDTRKLRIFSEEQSAQEAPLSRLANDTGGLFHHNNNDIHEGLRSAVHRHSSYYILTYNAPQQKSDGSYHHIKVEVSRGGLELSYRKGYYAPREELTFERRKKEDILEALKTPDNINEIPIGLAYNYYQEEDDRYILSLSTHVDIHRIRFLDEDSRRKNLFNLVVVAFDEMDHYVDGIEKSIDFKLTDPSYASLLDQGINSKVTFHVPLGRYKIKAVVREGTQGKMGSVTKAIAIP